MKDCLPLLYAFKDEVLGDHQNIPINTILTIIDHVPKRTELVADAKVNQTIKRSGLGIKCLLSFKASLPIQCILCLNCFWQGFNEAIRQIP